MTKLKLGPLVEGKPVKVTLKLAALLHRDLIAYAVGWLARVVSPLPTKPNGGQKWISL